ncbi:MAG: RNA-guided pseudouridylation complex pseudouridine synthase subunit Cbf5 [Thermoplasmata archaeon]|nr:RNA-guided pseudouridylation complex pseudouridine synthase subunit Cbf5 [Thermoplasmata archaeon]
MLRKSKMTIDSRYGKSPEERSIEELITNGIVIIDKPMGPSSHQIAAWVRDMLGAEKAGHGGTLDPRTTGVLPIGLGNAVRAMDYIHEAGKRYVGIMKLHADVREEDLKRIVKDFTGEIFQTPPVRSAVKRRMRTRRIFSLDIMERDRRNVLFDVKCEGGTYIRSLCVDIGDALGAGAHLQELRRTQAGPFSEKDSISLHTLRDAVEYWHEANPREIRKILSPVEIVFSGWKRVIVKDSAVAAICHGASLALPGIAELSKNINQGDKVAIMTGKDEIIATGIASMSSAELIEKKDGIGVVLERVFMAPSTYPKSWASKT